MFFLIQLENDVRQRQLCGELSVQVGGGRLEGAKGARQLTVSEVTSCRRMHLGRTTPPFNSSCI
jgi:hypothetical protein